MSFASSSETAGTIITLSFFFHVVFYSCWANSFESYVACVLRVALLVNPLEFTNVAFLAKGYQANACHIGHPFKVKVTMESAQILTD